MSLPDWPGYQRFRDQLVAANPHDFYPPEWLDLQIVRGAAFPLIGDRAAMVVGVRQYPGGARVGVVKAGAGDLDELVNEMSVRAVDWARSQGCDHAMLEGRPGWQRAMNGQGWQTYQVALLKEL